MEYCTACMCLKKELRLFSSVEWVCGNEYCKECPDYTDKPKSSTWDKMLEEKNKRSNRLQYSPKDLGSLYLAKICTHNTPEVDFCHACAYGDGPTGDT